METEELTDDTPCSSIAVDSVLRIGYVYTSFFSLYPYIYTQISVCIYLCINAVFFLQAGLLWGVCSAPYSANKLGHLLFISFFSFMGFFEVLICFIFPVFVLKN